MNCVVNEFVVRGADYTMLSAIFGRSWLPGEGGGHWVWYHQEFLSPCPRYHVGGTVVHLDIGMRGQMSQLEKKLLSII